MSANAYRRVVASEHCLNFTSCIHAVRVVTTIVVVVVVTYVGSIVAQVGADTPSVAVTRIVIVVLLSGIVNAPGKVVFKISVTACVRVTSATVRVCIN